LNCHDEPAQAGEASAFPKGVEKADSLRQAQGSFSRENRALIMTTEQGHLEFAKLAAKMAMKLSLSPETERLIAEKVDSGRYQSADEVVREGLELLDERDNGGRSALEKNAVPGQVEPAPEKAQKVTDLVELFESIAAEVPDSVWDTVPRDLAQNHEHYLYGSKKQA